MCRMISGCVKGANVAMFPTLRNSFGEYNIISTVYIPDLNEGQIYKSKL